MISLIITRLLCYKFIFTRYAEMGAKVVTWDINSKGNQETVDMLKERGHQGFAFTVNMANKWALSNFQHVQRSVHHTPVH